MKNIKLLLLILGSILLLNSCSSDDDDDPVTTPTESIKLEGKWLVKEINFTSNVKAWKSETFSDVMDVFGWAPYMYNSVAGIEFTGEDYTDTQSGKTAKKFNFVTGSSYGGSGKVYWGWNASDDGKAFEVIQFNTQMPPYDFSMSKTSSLQETTIDGKRVLIFTTTLVSIDQDRMDESTNPMTRPKVAASATFTLVEASGEIDSEVSPALKLNGVEFKLPQQVDPEPEPDPTIVTKESLTGTAWLLKAGSKLYDPGMVTQDPIFEFAKLVTLYFQSESLLKFRYSYPLGIISTKETTWTYDNETYIVSYVKGEGQMASSSMKFVWKASYLIDGDSKSLILELQEVVNNAGQETESKLDLSKVDADLLKREFTSISGDDTEKAEVVNKNNYTIFK